jgi:hypothetical protein
MLKTLPWRMMAWGGTVGVLAGLIAVAFELVQGQICEYNQATEHEDCTTYSLFPFLLIQVFNTLNYYGVAITALATVAIGIFTLTLKLSTDKLWEAGEKQRRLYEDTAERQLRAYVFFESGYVKLIATEKGQFLDATIQFKNFGQTPAYKFVNWMIIDIRNTSSPPFDEQARAGVEGIIGPSGVSVFNGHKGPLGPTDIDDIRNGAKTIFIWGRIDYVDAFKTPRFFIFYAQNGIEIPGVGWQISSSNKPNEAN